ncbi:hypothetical protein BKA70DRAFT_1260157 [Coprinopsis sp. MPI-PUGE-AT-0042]|nr:hypothetical protein BKA70DRAFT_1260157 [Coprinopsis sp. MPI-PUGE-AT-0042]
MPQTNVRKRLPDVLNPYYSNEFKRHVLETKEGLPTWVGERHSNEAASHEKSQLETPTNAQTKGKGKADDGNEEEGTQDGDELFPSLVPPNVSWTAQEKSVFFKALRSHSRLRPDLIAECIGTKGVAQVCSYLDYLEEEKTMAEVRDVKRKKGGEDETSVGDQTGRKDDEHVAEEEEGADKGDREVAREEEAADDLVLEESDIEEDVDYGLDPYDLEGAMEVSDEWVDLEEHQARFLLLEELHIRQALQERNHEDPNEIKLVTLGRLFSIAELGAMETLLRQEEDADVHAVPDEVKMRYAGGQEPEEEEQRQSRRRGSSPHTRSPSPSKARVASPANVEQPLPSKGPIHGSKEALGESDDDFGDLNDDELDDELNGNRDGQGQGGQEEGRQGEIEEEHQDVDDEEAVDLLSNPELTREARRRLQKRLYMRRQRALKKGITSVDVTSVKLLPGRQRKVRLGKGKARAKANTGRKGGSKSGSTVSSSRSSRVTRSGASVVGDTGEAEIEGSGSDREGSPSDSGSDSDNMSSSEAEGYYAYGNKGGQTAYTRAKQMLQDDEIDAQVLREEGIELFNLNVLAKLISIYASNYRARHASPSEYPTLTSDKQPLISADLIRLLTACAIEFTTATVKRALIISEQQATLKEKTKVWRKPSVENSLNVSGEAVKLAARMGGVKTVTKGRYFASILGENRNGEQVDENNGLMDGDEQENARQREQSEMQLLHDLHSPHVYLPPAYRIPQTDEDVLIDDEYAYQKEIQADERVDKKDTQKAVAYEEELWGSV